MSDLDEAMPTTERPSMQRQGPERRKRSSLRIVVQEVRMLFGALSATLQDLARNTVMLRKHAHSTNDNLTILGLKLDLLLKNAGIELPPNTPSSKPTIEIGVDEEVGNGSADER